MYIFDVINKKYLVKEISNFRSVSHTVRENVACARYNEHKVVFFSPL